MEFTLLWAAFTGVAFLWAAARWTPATKAALDDPFGALLGAAVLGLAAGRLGAMILAGTNPLTHPADMLLVRGGVHTGIASAAALLSLSWMGRPRILTTLDAATVPALAGVAGWHLGCVWRDGCLGTATDLPWAVTAAGSAVSRHPTELYAAFLFLVAAWLLRLWGTRDPRLGYLAAAGLAAAGLIRLVTEPLRLSLGSGSIVWYAAALFGGSVAFGFLSLASRRNERKAGTG